MTVVENTPSGQTEAISFEFDLQHSPKKIWRALTEPELLKEWLLPVLDNLELSPGAGFTLQAPPKPGWDGAVNCKFVEIEPQKKLSYSWVVGELNTVVTFTLTPTDKGTRLSLLQTGFQPQQKHNFGGARYGWRMMSSKLVDVLAKLE